jgi:hypothetical protein
VAAIEQAKEAPEYCGKLPRAVLIAWARRAPVQTRGLRWAFREHFKHEEAMAVRQAGSPRVIADQPDMKPFGSEVARAIAEAQLGMPRRTDALTALERRTGPTVHKAFWSSGVYKDLLPGMTDGRSLGFVGERADHSFRATSLGDKLWEGMAMAPRARLAQVAPRDELDAACEKMRAMFHDHGFVPSDLVVAGSTPGSLTYFRQWRGDRWWRRRPGQPPVA